MSENIDSGILSNKTTSTCNTFSNTSLIVIFLIILSVACLMYYFYKNMTSKIDDEIDSVIKDINNILKKPINDFKLDDLNQLTAKNSQLLTLINTGKSLFPQYFSGYEKILNMKSNKIPSTFYFEETTSNTKDLETIRVEDINNILEKYKQVEKNINDKLINLQNQNKTLNEQNQNYQNELTKNQNEAKKLKDDFDKLSDDKKKLKDDFDKLSDDKKKLFDKLNDAEIVLNKSVLISNTIFSDPRKKLIFELINNNISVLLNFIKDKICPSFINPEFEKQKSMISSEIDRFNNDTNNKNKYKKKLEEELNKMTSNIILYYLILSKSNTIKIPSTFYVDQPAVFAFGGGGIGGGNLGPGFAGGIGGANVVGVGPGFVGGIGGGNVAGVGPGFAGGIGGGNLGPGFVGGIGSGNLGPGFVGGIGGGNVGQGFVGGSSFIVQPGISEERPPTLWTGATPINQSEISKFIDKNPSVNNQLPVLLELTFSPLKNAISRVEQLQILKYMGEMSSNITEYLLKFKNIYQMTVKDINFESTEGSIIIDCPSGIIIPKDGINLKLIRTEGFTDSDFQYLTEQIFNYGKNIIKILKESQSGFGSTPQGQKVLQEFNNMMDMNDLKQQIKEFIYNMIITVASNNIATMRFKYNIIIDNKNCNFNENTYIKLFSYNLLLSTFNSQLFKYLERYVIDSQMDTQMNTKMKNKELDYQYSSDMDENSYEYNNPYSFGSLIKQMNIDVDNIIIQNKDLTNQITSIMLFYIDKIIPGTKFDIDFGWKLPSNVTINKTNTLKIMDHYYNMLCGNQNKLKLYSNTLINLLIDFTDINFS